jgi:hypothetical protein
MLSMKRVALIAALALLATLAAAGCGGSKSSASDASVQWANGVCGAATSWKNELTKLVGGVRANGLSQQSLQTTATSAQAVTETFAATLRNLGAPDTNAGADAKNSIDTLATKLTKSADTIRSTLDSSSVSVAATTIAAEFTTMRTDIKSTVSSLQSLDAKGELKQAFDSADNCSSLTGG